jgi:hypothetical protein
MPCRQWLCDRNAAMDAAVHRDIPAAYANQGAGANAHQDANAHRIGQAARATNLDAADSRQRCLRKIAAHHIQVDRRCVEARMNRFSPTPVEVYTAQRTSNNSGAVQHSPPLMAMRI